MAKFIVIGERIHCISPVIREAMAKRDPAPILQRAKEQLDAGATYIDVNIGPAENDGEDLMKWAVTTIQNEFDNVPLALDTANKAAAANDAIVIALCSAGSVPADVDERMAFCQQMLEHGMTLGMEAEDLWFDPLFLVAKGMQEQQKSIMEAIRQFTEMGLNTTGGLSNVSNGMPKNMRPIMDSVMVSMCMAMGLTSAIVNPCDQRLMEAVKTSDILLNNSLYADSYLEL